MDLQKGRLVVESVLHVPHPLSCLRSDFRKGSRGVFLAWGFNFSLSHRTAYRTVACCMAPDVGKCTRARSEATKHHQVDYPQYCEVRSFSTGRYTTPERHRGGQKIPTRTGFWSQPSPFSVGLAWSSVFRPVSMTLVFKRCVPTHFR